MSLPAVEPAPPGVTPNYVNPQSTGYEIVAASVVTGVCALIGVIARLISKSVISKSIGWDDYYSVLAMVFAIGRIVGGCMMVHYGTGRHIWDEPLTNAAKTSPYEVAIDALYLWAIMFAKLSILALYIRIFGVNRTFKRISWALGGIIVFYCIGCTPMFILACIPGGGRSFAQVEAKQCVPLIGLNVAVGAINIATDTALLALPIPMLMKLQMSKGRKFAIFVAFGTGLVAWAASVVREILIVNLRDADATRTQVPDVVWLTVEMNVAILAGCLPVLLPLAHRVSNIEGLKYYLSSIASSSNNLRKKLSTNRLRPTFGSEPRVSESSKGMKTPTGSKPSNEEYKTPPMSMEESWVTQQQAERNTPRALNEGY